jgi:hypothetical protein
VPLLRTAGRLARGLEVTRPPSDDTRRVTRRGLQPTSPGSRGLLPDRRARPGDFSAATAAGVDAGAVLERPPGERACAYRGSINGDCVVLTIAEGRDPHSFAGINRAMIAGRIRYARGVRCSRCLYQIVSLRAVLLAQGRGGWHTSNAAMRPTFSRAQCVKTTHLRSSHFQARYQYVGGRARGSGRTNARGCPL